MEGRRSNKTLQILSAREVPPSLYIPPKLSSIGVEKDVFGTKKLILLKESYSFDDLVDNDTDNDTFWLTGENDLLTFFTTL